MKKEKKGKPRAQTTVLSFGPFVRVALIDSSQWGYS